MHSFGLALGWHGLALGWHVLAVPLYLVLESSGIE